VKIIANRKLLSISGFIVVTLVLLSLGLRWFERALTFQPAQWYAGAEWSKPAEAEEVWLKTSDGIRLNGWYFRQQRSEPMATILFFHGNGGNIVNLGWFGERLVARGFDVLVFDYRGYGKSEGRSGEELALYADGDAALAFLLSRGVAISSMVFYGQSLGTAVATHLAAQHQPAALILESGFTSASDLALDILPWLPRKVHSFGKYRFDTIGKLKQVKSPVLITHGDPDQTIPTRHARALYGAANEPKKLLIIPGVGHNVFGAAGSSYLDSISEFVRASIDVEAAHQASVLGQINAYQN
jgi:hypothetical protein